MHVYIGSRTTRERNARREVSALRRDARDGTLTPWHAQACEGRNPVHLALDPSARYLIVSNHLTGAVAVPPVADDGALAAVSQTVPLAGEPGPHRKEQPFSKLHWR